MLESVLQNSYCSSMTETAVYLSLIFLHTLLVIDLLLFLCVCVCLFFHCTIMNLFFWCTCLHFTAIFPHNFFYFTTL